MGTNYRNYSIKQSKGVFYESTKDMQEGFNIRYETQSKEIRYHRESQEIGGVLKKIALKKFNFGKGDITYLRIMFDEINGDTGTLSIPLMTQKGGLDQWIKQFMLYLPNLKKGQDIKIQLNRRKKDNGGYLHKNVWMHEASDDSLIAWAFDPRREAGIVPQPINTPHPVTKEVKLDFTPVDTWYYQELMKVIEAWGGNQEGEEEEDESKKLRDNESYVGNTPVSAPSDEGTAYDDLPF